MKIMKYAIAVCFLIVCLGCASSVEPPAVKHGAGEMLPLSPEASRILSAIGYQLSTSKDELCEVSVLVEGDTETITFSPPEIMSDGMTHVVKIDHGEKQYWITVSGGIAGVYKVEGPFDIK